MFDPYLSRGRKFFDLCQSQGEGKKLFDPYLSRGKEKKLFDPYLSRGEEMKWRENGHDDLKTA